MENEEALELLPDSPNRILTVSSLLKVGDRYYKTQMITSDTFTINDWTDSNKNESFTFNDIGLDDQTAYLLGDYYYLYRGKVSDAKGFETIKPGIYYNDEECGFNIVEPETDDEKEEYKYSDKITRSDAEEIRNAVLNHEVVIFNTPDSSHSVIPGESAEDDLLKRLIKRAIFEKGIDLDQYKIRFASKNMLFNTKQVLRGDNKLSMLLFDRCTEAFNLKYTIILEENGGEIVGIPLKGKLVLSSHDVFDANGKNDSSEIVDSEEDEEI